MAGQLVAEVVDREMGAEGRLVDDADVVHVHEVFRYNLPVARHLEFELVRSFGVFRLQKCSKLTDPVFVQAFAQRTAIGIKIN